MAEQRRKIELYPDERTDDLERNGLFLIQKKKGFCFGMDAVLLSGFAEVKDGEQAADLGTGTGIIPVLLSAKSGGRQFYGIEVQPEVAEMAASSVYLNALEDRVKILSGNLREILTAGQEIVYPLAVPDFAKRERLSENGMAESPEQTGEVLEQAERGSEEGSSSAPASESISLAAGSFDVVTSNPPYMKTAHGLQNPNALKAISRHELLCTLPDVCGAAAKLLKSGGRFYMVHRPQRIAEIISALRDARLEPKRMKFVHPFADREANMVLIEAVKDAGAECRVEKPLIVYQAEGKYTDEIYEIYGY